MRRKRLNKRANFTVTRAIRRVLQHMRFRRHGFLSRPLRNEAAKRRQLPSVCRNAPEVCRKTRSDPRAVRPSTLNPSTGAYFLVYPIRSS
jgi:hypothetical protein